jgi:hypothetical protein
MEVIYLILSAPCWYFFEIVIISKLNILKIKTFFFRARDDSFYENILQIKTDLKLGLEDFDKKWVAYEQVKTFNLINFRNILMS